MLGRNLLATVITQVPIFVLGVVSGVFSTRMLGEEAKGVFSVFQANLQLFVLVFSLGIQTGVVYFISSGKIPKSLVLGMSLVIISYAAIVLGLILFSLYYSNTTNFLISVEYGDLTCLMISFFMFLLSSINGILAAVFQAYSKFRTINIISVSNSVINTLFFLLIFIVYKNENLSSKETFDIIMYSTALLLVINTVFWLVAYIKAFGFLPSFKFKGRGHLKVFIAYNLLVYFGTIINFFNYRLDLWIVNYNSSPEDLSFYSLAANICQILLYASVTISTVIFPNFSRKDEASRIKTFIEISRYSFLFFLILVLFAFVLAPIVIPLLYGQEFYGTVLPFQVLLPGILFSCITQVFSIFLVSSNRNIYNIIACSIGLFFTVILDFALIPEFGIFGAALATLISYFVIFLVTFLYIQRKFRMGTLNFFWPKLDDLKSLKNKIRSFKR